MLNPPLRPVGAMVAGFELVPRKGKIAMEYPAVIDNTGHDFDSMLLANRESQSDRPRF